MSSQRKATAVGAVLVAAIAVAALWPLLGTPKQVPSQDSSVTASPAPLGPHAQAALEQLDGIPIAEPTGLHYDRALFGQRWADVDRNGCDQRNDVLRRDLLDVTLKPGTRDCVVLAGTLHDLYTGTSIAFMRGQGTSELVQIDHVVPLSFAFQQGAASWDSDRREQFANDFTNLQATDGPTNLSKGDAGPARWMPPAADYRCDYAIRFIDIAASYQLSLPLGDHQALSAQLQDCRDSGP